MDEHEVRLRNLEEALIIIVNSLPEPLFEQAKDEIRRRGLITPIWRNAHSHAFDISNHIISIRKAAKGAQQ